MFAVRIDQYGPAESLSVVDALKPVPGPMDVLVRVHAIGVNRLDLLLREGEIFKVPLPRIPGTDFSGEIVEVGTMVRDRKVGEKVFAAPILSCGTCEHCRHGEDNLCSQFGTVGSTIDGGYAEYVCIPARNAVPMRENMDYVKGASFALTYATAAAMLRRGRLQAGESILVLGANGGLGYAAVELARLTGAAIIAVSRDDHVNDRLLELGAAAVVAPGPNMAEEVRGLTQGRGVDMVFEHVAAATFEQSLASLAINGRLVLGGVTTGTQAPLDLKAIFAKRLEILGCRGSGRVDLDRVLGHMARGELNPHVQQVLPLNQTVEAHRMLESGNVFGKIVLTV